MKKGGHIHGPVGRIQLCHLKNTKKQKNPKKQKQTKQNKANKTKQKNTPKPQHIFNILVLTSPSWEEVSDHLPDLWRSGSFTLTSPLWRPLPSPEPRRGAAPVGARAPGCRSFFSSLLSLDQKIWELEEAEWCERTTSPRLLLLFFFLSVHYVTSFQI